MSQAMFKKAVQWLGIVILAHIAAMILFAIVMAGSAESLAKDSPADAYRMVMTFDIIFYAVFVFLVNRLETSYADYQRNLKNAVKTEGFTLVGYYKENFLKEKIVKAAVLGIFHIPFAVFYQVLGLSLTETTGFEKFYILDAGFYGVAGSSILGFLLGTLITAVIYFAIGIVSFVIDCHIQKKEIASFGSHQ